MRWLLVSLGMVWAALILACIGAGGKWVELPGGQTIYRSDYRDYYSSNTNTPGLYVDGHITDVGFDDQFILLRRAVCKHIDRRRFDGRTNLTYELTGVIEFYILELSSSTRHGPLTEAEFSRARELLGVQAELALEPTDRVRARIRRQ